MSEFVFVVSPPTPTLAEYVNGFGYTHSYDMADKNVVEKELKIHLLLHAFKHLGDKIQELDSVDTELSDTLRLVKAGNCVYTKHTYVERQQEWFIWKVLWDLYKYIHRKDWAKNSENGKSCRFDRDGDWEMTEADETPQLVEDPPQDPGLSPLLIPSTGTVDLEDMQNISW